MLGFEPGKLYFNQWFQKVDSLTFKQGFYTDHNEIFKIDTTASLAMETTINSYYKLDLYNYNWQVSEHKKKEVYDLVEDFMDVHAGRVDNESAKKYNEIKNKEDRELNTLDKAILDHTYSPINNDGFRSIDFDVEQEGSKSVILLGDSHTWGHTTSNKTNSFADILLVKGYMTFNTGISGAGPAQYMAVAKEYIPKLMPDVVIINIFLGNDIQDHKRIPKPNKPLLYSTNARKLMSFRYGEMLDTNTIYDQALITTYLPEKGIFSNVCKKLAITWLLYGMVDKFLLIKQRIKKVKILCSDKYDSRLEEPSIVNEMEEICKLTKKYHAELYVCLLPELRYRLVVSLDQYNKDFSNEYYHIPKVSRKHYKLSDGHLIDLGHKVYAQFLTDLIESK